jgi:hypothetical protein
MMASPSSMGWIARSAHQEELREFPRNRRCCAHFACTCCIRRALMSPMSTRRDYLQPENVTAPRLRWRLIKVLFKGDPADPSKHNPDGYSVAVGMWDNGSCLAIRWNASDDRPIGSPQSRGLPTWFIVPPGLVEPILKTLPQAAQSFARSVL